MLKGHFALRAAVAAALTVVVVTGQSPAPQALVPGATVTRSLRGGGLETFGIDLTSGQFVLINIEQHGIDVSARIASADGSDALVRDSPNAENGPECVAFIAETTGTYRLTVRSLDSSSSVPAGTVVIRVEAVRSPAPEDREHVEADGLFHEAVQLRAQNTAATRAQALERLAAALGSYERLGRLYEGAMALHSTGLAHLRGGEPRRAIAFLERAATVFRDLGSPMFASTVNALGGADDLLGNISSAVDRYEQALQHFRTSGSATGEGLARNNLGKLFSDKADWQRALQEYREALVLFTAAGDRNREGLALYNIGMSYEWLGESDQATAHLSRALAIWRASADRSGQAEVLTSMGSVELAQGRPERALEHLMQAVSLRQIIGDRRSEGTTRTFIGQALLDMRRVDEAITHLEQAIELRRSGGDRRGAALASLGLSRAYTASGSAERGLSMSLEALATFRELGDRNGAANALRRVAEAQGHLGRLDEAIAHNEEAIELVEAVRGGVSSPELRAGYFGRQNNAYDGLIALLMRRSVRDGRADDVTRALEVSERARARSLLEMLGEGDLNVVRGVDGSLTRRERELADLINVKSERLMPLITRDRGSAAAQTMLREIAELEAEYGEVRANVRKSSPAYAALTQPEPLGLSAIQREVLDDATRLIEYSLGDEASFAWIVDTESIRAVRLPGRLEVEDAAREVYGHVTARGVAQPGETAAQRNRRIAASAAALPEALQRLSDLVIAPLGDLAAGSRLLVVADGALQYIPFGMLPERAADGTHKPLVVDHEIVTMPSASVLAVQREQLKTRARPGAGVAVIADPVFDRTDARLARLSASSSAAPTESSDTTRMLEHIGRPAPAAIPSAKPQSIIPRLPFTRREADAILAVAKGQKNFRAVDFAATKEAVLGGALENYRIVHFATHGLLDTERPTLSSIVLSLVDRDGNPRDGYLRAQELYNLELNADLVVLSACQTGLGKSIEGEGLIGLTRGLMYAGAQRVVVSLWNVSDRATATLMSRFYRDMLTNGKTPSAALRAAQLEVMKIKGWENPYYWAPFVMQGDWR